MSLLANGTIEYSKCPVCGAKVTQLRRGRCISCYSKWIEEQPVAVGASCRVCGDKRRENIQKVELLGRWFYLCHICAYRSVRLEPVPKHIEEIRAQLKRDKRYVDRRLDNKDDDRNIKREHRVGERRVVFLGEDDIIYDDELHLDYDEPIDEGEATGVFEKISLKDLSEPDQVLNTEIELEL
jgi:hypothetical protein